MSGGKSFDNYGPHYQKTFIIQSTFRDRNSKIFICNRLCGQINVKAQKNECLSIK